MNALMYWLMSYKVSETIMNLDELGIFSLLISNDLSAEEISIALNLDKDSLILLLDLLVSVSVLEKMDGKYHLPKPYGELLPMVKIENAQKKWNFKNKTFEKVLKFSERCDSMDDLSSDLQLFENYFKAMEASVRAIALNIVKFCKLHDGMNIMDLGGADGSLSILLSKYFKNSQFIVVDREASESLFYKKMNASGKKSKIAFLADDLTNFKKIEPILEKQDVIILSNILHLLPMNSSQKLLKTLMSKTSPKAKIIIYDQFLEKKGGLSASDFMVVDWVFCKTIFNYTADQFVEYLKEQGFNNFKILNSNTLSGQLIMAEK